MGSQCRLKMCELALILLVVVREVTAKKQKGPNFMEQVLCYYFCLYVLIALL